MSCLAKFLVRKTWISSSKTRKTLFAAIDITLADLEKIRNRTSIYWIYFIWSKSSWTQFTEGKTRISSSITKKKKIFCSKRPFFSIFSTDKTQVVDIYQIYFIWSKSCLSQFSIRKTWISSAKTKKSLFVPFELFLTNIVQIRHRKSIYTGFTSFGASHVKRIFQYGKREFRPPKRKKLHLLRLTIL
jgi:hypothetical protein